MSSDATSTAPPLTAGQIATLVDRFYERVRVHPELGPVFNPAVHDWAEHKDTLVAFWCSVELGTREYRGQPMAKHRPHPIRREHFDQWLALWEATADEVLSPEGAARMHAHARRIADSLMYGLGLDARRRPLGLPVVAADPAA